jgi:general secretion pathway protein K
VTAPRRDQRGFALLIVLWTLSLFALVGTQLTLSARTEARLATNLRADAVSEAAADGAVYEAVFHLLDGGRNFWPLSGAHRVVMPGAVVDVLLENQAGRINPNLADPSLLQGILTAVGVDRTTAVSLAAAIIDWRSPNRRATPNGAKGPQYLAAGRDWGPPGSPLRDLEEMGEILGMTPAILEALAPHLSLYWDGDPDPTVADPVVLDAIRRAAHGGDQAQMPGMPMQSDSGLGAAQGGAPPPPSVAAGDEQVVAITAAAIGPAGSRFTRHAIVQITLSGSGKRWHLVAWDPPPV